MHIVVVITHTSIYLGKNKYLYGVSSNYTINGINKPDGYQSYDTSNGGFDPNNWNVLAKLNIYPNLDVLSTVNNHLAGSIYYFSMYNRVR